MKVTTALDKIKKIVDQIDFERFYIEIETAKDKYTVEQEREHKVEGFKKQ